MYLSIIIPVYNVESYIRDCIDSLLYQDIPSSEYEIICVDDGSTDNSAKIIKNYMQMHNNIKLIQQVNSGVGKARNVGLSLANGKFIWFIDPDDFISSNCFGFIIKSLNEYSADILEINYKACPEESSFSPSKTDYYVDGVDRFGAGASACIYIASNQLLEDNQIRFNERLSYGEDYLWAFQLKATKHKNIVTNAFIYNYRQRKGSAMNTKSFKKAQMHFDGMLLLGKEYEKEYCKGKQVNLNDKLLHNLIKRKDLCVQSALFDMLKMNLSTSEIKKQLSKLNENHMYPYPIMWEHIKPNSTINHTLLAWFTLLFPCEWYYIMCFKIIRLLKK